MKYSTLGIFLALSVGTVWTGEEMTMPVVLEKIENGDGSSGWLLCRAQYAQKKDEPIWIEAEQATRLVFEPGGFENEAGAFPGEDPEAGEGRYIAYIARAIYELDIKTFATYRVWY